MNTTENTVITEEEYLTIKQYEKELNMIVTNKSAYHIDLVMKNKLITILEKYNIMKGCPVCNTSITLYINSLALMKHYEQLIEIAKQEDKASQNENKQALNEIKEPTTKTRKPRTTKTNK